MLKTDFGENLQNIEAVVTFSLGLQPTTPHEYEFWHARRMACIQIMDPLLVGTFASMERIKKTGLLFYKFSKDNLFLKERIQCSSRSSYTLYLLSQSAPGLV